MTTPLATITMRVSSSATNLAGDAWGQQPDQGAPSFLDMHVTATDSSTLFPVGTYDAYCLDPYQPIGVKATTFYLAETFAGNTTASFMPAGFNSLLQAQVDQLNWLLGQNFTSDSKFAGQFNYGEVQLAVWKILGFSDYQPDSTATKYLTDNNRNVLDTADSAFLVSAAEAAIASGKGGLPIQEAFSAVIDPVARVTNEGITPIDYQPQPLIVQQQSAKLGNFVWLDCNNNGIQDAGEAGVDNLLVSLYDKDGNLISSTTTGDDYSTAAVEQGYYQFVGLKAGDYQVKFIAPHYQFTVQDASGNTQDAYDSDANPVTGFSQLVTLTAGESNQTIDAGLIPCRSVTFDFSGSSCLNGYDGNARTYTDALTGVQVTARAFSETKGTDNWQKAWLGEYSQGLGVTDSSEGDGSNNTHTVDNVGRNNYIVLQFSEVVTVDKAYLGYVLNDSDMQAWIGNSAAPITWMSDSVLASMDFSETSLASNGSTRWAELNANEARGNVLIIAADTQDSTPDDRFKMEKLTVCAPTDCCEPVTKASVGNLVWEDMNYNGLQDNGELGIANVMVKLLNSSGTVLGTTSTNSSGEYLFSNLDPGDYQVQVVKPSGYYITKGNQGVDDGDDSDVDSSGITTTINLSPGEEDMSWDAGLYRKACVGDKVWDDMNHNNIQDYNEPGIKNITVKLLNSSGSVLSTTTTDSNGNYKFINLNPGTYQLQFDKTNVQHYNYNQWNNMSYWKWAEKDVGSNDTKDSDVTGDAVSTTNVTRTSTFTLVSGQSDMTKDAGITPIVIDLDGNGIQTVARADSGGTFDLFGNGSAVESGWIASGEGFLAVDKNGNGKIDNITELFGGTAKGAGFAQLASYDSNGDGLINASDAAFSELAVWRDADGNHQTDDGELVTLSEAGLAALDAHYTELPFLDRQGNLHLERSSATMSNGQTVDMTDIYFSVSADAAAAAGVSLPGIAGLLSEEVAANNSGQAVVDVSDESFAFAANDAQQCVSVDPGWLFA